METFRSTHRSFVATSPWVLLAIASALVTACASSDEEAPIERSEASIPFAELEAAGASDDVIEPALDDAPGPNLFPIDGYLEGRLGSVALDAVPYRMEARITPDDVHIGAFTEGEGGEGMIAIRIHGGLHHRALDGGRLVQLRGIAPTDPSAFWVNVVGCSGLRAPQWAYDQGATDVSIRVIPGPTAEQVSVEISATFGTGLTTPSSIRGYVTLGS